MAGAQRIYKQKIRATETLEKVFNAMEMIAASRVGAARRRATEATPYSQAITKALQALAMHAHFDHPLTSTRNDTKRVAVLAVASDRGMAGAYSSTILHETDKLLGELREDGKEPVLYVVGRRTLSYFKFRGVTVEESWEGNSDNPTTEVMYEVGDRLLERFLDQNPETGVGAVYLVFTRFESMLRQVPEIRQMLPLKIVSAPKSVIDGEDAIPEPGTFDLYPEYEFIPSAEAVLDRLLPMYVSNRIVAAMLEAAASELASRQRAMRTASDNARELITNYTRLANQARQAEITQEITEIVSGANALTGQL